MEHLACAVLSCVKLLLSAIKSERPHVLHPKASSNLFHYQTSNPAIFSISCVLDLCALLKSSSDICHSETRYLAIFALSTLKPCDKKPTTEKVKGEHSVLGPPCLYFSDLTTSRPPGDWVHQRKYSMLRPRPEGFSFASYKFLIQLATSLLATMIRKAS